MQAGAVATKGVLGDACAAGDRERSSMAYVGARVPEVLSATELEGFFAGFVPELLEPPLGASIEPSLSVSFSFSLPPSLYVYRYTISDRLDLTRLDQIIHKAIDGLHQKSRGSAKSVGVGIAKLALYHQLEVASASPKRAASTPGSLQISFRAIDV